jgi:hypothetical protein
MTYNRQRRIVRPELRQQIESFLAGGGVARVIQVHQDRVEFRRVDRFENAGR